MNDTPIPKDEPEKNWNLYVLRQEQGKYYVGITTLTPERRMQQHVDGFMGARWTKKYKPLEIIEQQNLGLMTKHEAELIENKKTRELMSQYGDNNVRGGDLSYSDTFVKRFGWYIAEKDWEILTAFVFLMLVILILGVLLIKKQ